MKAAFMITVSPLPGIYVLCLRQCLSYYSIAVTTMTKANLISKAAAAFTGGLLTVLEGQSMILYFGRKQTCMSLEQ